jgi:Sulfotransferase family
VSDSSAAGDGTAVTADAAQGSGVWSGACADPVFVLCAGRSGSTLLRFLLDAHPELACPPETELPAMCTQVAKVWSIFETSSPGQPGGAAGTEPAVPEPVIAGMRHAVDLMVGPYLARRGKKRYCDKSLGSARQAGLLTRMYPDARFVCLYRHPMDLISSGLEACPWGLNAYGFEHYIGGSPARSATAGSHTRPARSCWSPSRRPVTPPGWWIFPPGP